MSITTELQRIYQAKTDLKASIEAKGVAIEDTATIDTYAPKVDDVYSAGYEKGKSEGGGDSFYDTFWDARQSNGTPCDYSYAFYGKTWTTETFKPKYDIVPTKADYIFSGAFSSGFDLVEHLNSIGKSLDFSKCTSLPWLIYSSYVTHLGVIDMRSVTSASGANNVFREANALYAKLKTIDKLIVSSNYPMGTSSFGSCGALEDITIEGTITGNFTIQNSSKLTVESAKSIITHLANYAGTEKEFTQSVKFHENVWSVLDAEGNTSPNGTTWKEYVQDVLCWNI